MQAERPMVSAFVQTIVGFWFPINEDRDYLLGLIRRVRGTVGVAPDGPGLSGFWPVNKICHPGGSQFECECERYIRILTCVGVGRTSPLERHEEIRLRQESASMLMRDWRISDATSHRSAEDTRSL